MMKLFPVSAAVAMLLALTTFSCTTLRYDETRGDYQKLILQLQEKLVRNPNDADLLRDLGIAHFQIQQYPKAEEHLKRSVEINGKDAKSLFYYGVTLESETKTQAALAVYINYTDFSALSQYRKLMEGRFRVLQKEIIKQQMQTLLAQEQQLGDQDSSSTRVAIFPLQYQSSNEKYSTLGLGLSEMITIDLGQVKSIKLVERLRIEALLNELAFAQSKNVDPTTAPRLGRLLTAGRIVSGSYNISDDEKLRMDVASWDVLKKEYPEPTTEADQLDNLFKVEKDLVFGVIKDMGIILTREEQERIQRIPTKNLQAFLLYSKGLDDERRNDFKAAEAMYKQAVVLDPGFAPARDRGQSMQSMSVAGGNLVDVVIAARAIEPPIQPTVSPQGPDLIGNRLQNLSNGVGGSFVPGPDSRKAPEEGLATRVLPRPPPPPKP